MQDNGAVLRQATAGDVDVIAAVELAAAQTFDDRDVSPARKLQTMEPAKLARSIADGLTWVALSPTGAADVVGFVAAQRIREALYILEIDVIPGCQRMGIGSMLLDVVAAAARDLGCACITLTTFSHVPWNRPFYERKGFVEVSGRVWPHLADQLEAERFSGLKNRIAMYRNVGSADAA